MCVCIYNESCRDPLVIRVLSYYTWLIVLLRILVLNEQEFWSFLFCRCDELVSLLPYLILRHNPFLLGSHTVSYRPRSQPSTRTILTLIPP